MDQAIGLAPDNPVMLNGRCWGRAIANRQTDGAIADCNAALGKAPSDTHILDSLGFAWFRKGDFDKAIAQYDLALAAKPDLGLTLYKRGLAKIRKGDPGGGKADIARALALDPHAGDEMTEFGILP